MSMAGCKAEKPLKSRGYFNEIGRCEIAEFETGCDLIIMDCGFNRFEPGPVLGIIVFRQLPKQNF
jgi:hypothetical protein